MSPVVVAEEWRGLAEAVTPASVVALLCEGAECFRTGGSDAKVVILAADTSFGETIGEAWLALAPPAHRSGFPSRAALMPMNAVMSDSSGLVTGLVEGPRASPVTHDSGHARGAPAATSTSALPAQKPTKRRCLPGPPSSRSTDSKVCGNLPAQPPLEASCRPAAGDGQRPDVHLVPHDNFGAKSPIALHLVPEGGQLGR